MNSKLFYIFIVWSILFITSCRFGGASCGRKDKNIDPYFHAQYMNAFFRTRDDRQFEQSYDQYYNEIKIIVIFNGTTYSMQNRRSSWINTAYACSPNEPESQDIITNISIRCTEDYDNEHPKGNSLNDLFIVETYPYKRSTIDELVARQVTVKTLEFYLTKAPTKTKKYQFIIDVETNGKLATALSDTTSGVYIKGN